VMLPVWLQLNF